MPASQAEQLVGAARSQLRGCSRVVIFDAAGTVLHASFEGVSKKDAQSLTAAVVGSREQAIRQGLHIQGRRYEVHQHHPSLVWGRSMQGDPETSTGAAVCQGAIGGKPVYIAITFELPATTARMVALLAGFCRKYCPLT